jgi:hypothetical protein
MDSLFIAHQYLCGHVSEEMSDVFVIAAILEAFRVMEGDFFELDSYIEFATEIQSYLMF